jgi:hypothetical protein
MIMELSSFVMTDLNNHPSNPRYHFGYDLTSSATLDMERLFLTLLDFSGLKDQIFLQGL